MKNKNAEKLASFTAYCKENPKQRFWQALRNWGQFDFIYAAKDESLESILFDYDTFYIE